MAYLKVGDYVKVVKILHLKADKETLGEQKEMFLGRIARVVRLREETEKHLTRRVQIVFGYSAKRNGEELSFNEKELRKATAGELAAEAL